MKENALQEFKNACASYLKIQSLNDLRAYARMLHFTDPTKLKKDDLLEQVVAAVAGEIVPAGRNGRGAPVKNNYVPPTLIQTIENLKKQYCKLSIYILIC